MNVTLHQGCNLQQALQVARRHGVNIEAVRRTGEIRFRHATQTRTVRCNGRRKDASRAVVAFLRQVVDRDERRWQSIVVNLSSRGSTVEPKT